MTARGRERFVAAVALCAAVGLGLLFWRDPGPSAPPPAAAAVPPALPGEPGTDRRPGASAIADRRVEGGLAITVIALGRPAVGAAVSLYALGPALGSARDRWSLVASARAGLEGSVVLPVAPGTYLASARLPGYGPARAFVRRFAGEARGEARLILPGPAALSGKTVRKGSSEPVAFAALRLVPVVATDLAREEEPDAPAEEESQATSDAFGAFRLSGLAPGRYWVLADAPGVGKALLAPLAVPRASELTVALGGAGGVSGVVLGGDGAPAPGARVTVSGTSGEETLVTGSSGGFAGELLPGAYWIRAERGAEAAALPGRISVAEGAVHSGIVLRLGPASAVTGRVVDARGEPVPGARVLLHQDRASASWPTRSGATDSSGRFEFAGLPAGAFLLFATAPGRGAAQHDTIALRAGQRAAVELTLGGAGSVAGAVRDANGVSVEGARVGLEGAPRVPEARTDANGHYRLEGVPAGSAEVVARRAEGEPPVVGSVEVPAGSTATLDFELPDSALLAGRVRTEGGQAPPSPAWVVFQPLVRGPRLVFTPASEEGHYRMRVPAGAGRAQALLSPGGLDPLARAVTVTPRAGETTWLDLALPDDAPGLSGEVLEPDGSPSVDAEVNGVPAMPGAWARTDALGRFALPRAKLRGTRVTLRAHNGGRSGVVSDVVVGSVGVQIRLSRGALAHGRVSIPGGSAVPGFRLEVGTVAAFDQASDWVLELGRDVTGDRFELEDLPAQPLRFMARTADGLAGAVEVTLVEGGDREVDIPLAAGASVSGRVIEKGAGKPGCLVLLDSNLQRAVDTDGGGRFRIEQLSPGRHRLELWKDEGKGGEVSLDVAPGEHRELGDVVFLRSAPDAGASAP